MDWLYSDKVKDHFQNPRNVMGDESLFEDDGKGMVGNPKCGDIMLVGIKVDKKEDRIVDFKWKTYGCASALGSTSILSEMVIEKGGMKVDEALALKPQDIIDRLEGLPENKIHCSVLGDKALRAAIIDYFRRTDQIKRIPVDDAKVVCECLNVTDKEIKALVEDGVETFEELQARTKVATGCGKCKEDVEQLLKSYLSS